MRRAIDSKRMSTARGQTREQRSAEAEVLTAGPPSEAPPQPASAAVEPRAPAPGALAPEAGEARYRALAEAAQDYIFIISSAGLVEYVNEAGAGLFGERSAALVGRRMIELFPPETGAQQWQSIRAVLERSEPRYAESLVPFPSGRRWLGTWLTPLRDAQGTVSAALGVSRDISERKQFDQSLLERSSAAALGAEVGAALTSAADLREALRRCAEAMVHRLGAATVGIWSLDEAAEALALQARVGLEAPAAAIPNQLRFDDAGWGRVAREGRVLVTNPLEGEARLPGRDWAQTEALVAYAGYPLVVTGRTVGLLSLFGRQPWSAIALSTLESVANMMAVGIDRQRASEALRASEASLATAQRIAQLGSWAVEFKSFDDLDQNPLRWSDEVCRIFGYEPKAAPLTRASFYLAVHPDDRERVQQAAKDAIFDRQPYELEHRIVRPDGSQRMVYERAAVFYDSVDGRPQRMVGTVQDITERKRLEEQVRQAQKMEGIGQLAGGVAHDFNNILTIIGSSLGLLRMQPGLTADSRDLLEQASKAVDRAANLTRQLLTFSRKQPLRPQCLDLNEVVSGLTKMLRRIIGEDVNLECKYAADLASVWADVGMIEQVLLNLAVNARDAMVRGGRLVIQTENCTIEADRAARLSGARAGAFVRLRVQDTGCGIAAGLLPHIFEPFFTTKEVGKGTGLGLATVYGIVQQHQGWIEVDSLVGVGTTLDVYLPPAGQHQVAEEVALPKAIPGGSELVLVVEDDDALRLLVRLCLERYGYRVLGARHGRDALHTWSEHSARIDLLLTDLVLPGGLTGREVAQRLKAQRPSLKVLYTSGYSVENAKANDLVVGVNYLPKPYEPSELARAVRRCLDAR